ncbi:MAG: 3-deoxy-7-phosphoheptulonate synthase [Candidatus Izemoplasmataceae bacterium]
MIVTLKKDAALSDIKKLKDDLVSAGFECHDSKGKYYTLIHVIGDTSTFDAKKLYAYECVEDVTRIQEPFKKVNKSSHPLKTIIKVKTLEIGSNTRIYIGGPCSVESLSQMKATAKAVHEAGAHILRGGAFKPRTSPYSFQGLKEDGLKILKEAADLYQLATISELVNKEDVPLFEKYVDIIQIGARNMQNFELLKALGNTKTPVLLKRGFGNTIEEWLMSAEYILNSGNPNVILCERGIRTFESYTRTTLDISSVLAIKQLSHLPIFVDPSHAAGKWELVEGLSKASIGAGADGLMIEVHPHPERALSDGAQSLKPEKFIQLIKDLNKLTTVL